MPQQKDELRLKIKKLKYKLEKQQHICNQLQQHEEHLKVIARSQLNISRVLKKINFLLSLKGMTITDWVHSCEYQYSRKGDKSGIQISLDNLVDVLEMMRIRLEAPQKNILLNFLDKNMSCWISPKDIFNAAQECGLKVS